MRRFYLFVFIAFFLNATDAGAQLNGTYGVGTGQTYPTIQAALTAASLPAGISGSVVFELRSATTSETYPVTVNAVPGSSALRTVTIRPAAGINYTAASSNTTGMFNFNGCDNIIIDGRQGGTGLLNSITISSTSNTAYAINLQNGAQNNTIRNCNIYGTRTTANAGLIHFGGTTTVGNIANLITECYLGDNGALTPNCIIYSGGNAAALNTGNNITNNFIYDYYAAAADSYGIYVASNSSGWTISGNRFYQTATRTSTGTARIYAIRISTTNGGGYIVRNNVIGYGNNFGTGVTSYAGSATAEFTGIEFNGNGTYSDIHGNTIAGINFTGQGSVSPSFTGIEVQSGAVSVGYTSANTIGSASGTGSIVVNNNTSGLLIVTGIIVTSDYAYTIGNNRIGSISAAGNTSADITFRGIVATGNGNPTVVANTVGNATSDNISVGAAGTSTGITSAYGIWCNSPGSFNTIGGTAANANTIQNISCNGSGTSSVLYGIYKSNSAGTVILSNNVISTNKIASNAATTQGFNQAGIYNTGAATVSTTISNNSFPMTQNTNAAFNGTAACIYSSSYTAATPLTINNNSFAATSWPNTAGGSYFYYIYSATTCSALTISSNQITGGTFGDVSVRGITDFGNSTGTVISSNTVTGITAEDWLIGIHLSNSSATGIASVQYNDVGNLTTTTASVPVSGIYVYAPNRQASINSNTIHDITATGGITGVQHTAGGNGTSVSFNNIRNNSAAGVMYGISLNNASSNIVSCAGNNIYSLSTSGNFFFAQGIYSYGIRSTLYQNKIYDLSVSGSGSSVNGITISDITGGGSHDVYNNIIGRLYASNVAGSDVVRGINIEASATTTTNLSYNTVYLDGTSSQGTFGTSALRHAYYNTSSTNNLISRNNLLINNSTAKGSGAAVAFRRTGNADLNNYSTLSNNNLYYAGTPGVRNLIYSDGTNADQTINRFRYRMLTRDQKSVSDLPTLLSMVGNNANFLHLDATVASRAESGGTPITGLTIDYDAQTRNTTAPDIGADEISGSMKDSTRPVITLVNAVDSCNGMRRIRATIADNSGIPSTTAGTPRVYYRKPAGSFASAPGVRVLGSLTNGTWDFIIDPIYIPGGVVAGNTVEFFLIAQDIIASVPNIGSNPSTGIYADDVSTIIKAPDVLNSYTQGTIKSLYTWLGYSNDWFNPVNWCGGMIPDANADVLIPTSVFSTYPQVTSGNAITRNLSFESNAFLGVFGAGKLSINGVFSYVTPCFDLNTGTLELSYQGLVFPAASILTNELGNLIISRNTTLSPGAGNMLKLNGKLSFTGSGRSLETNGNLTLLSSATKTAEVADMTNGGLNNSNLVLGDVVVERYIPATRKWRMLASPVSGSQSIRNAWMEGATAIGQNPVPGYGMIVTDNLVTWNSNGFDAQSISGPSVKYYNPVTQTYAGIGTPDESINSAVSFMAFVRGNRLSTPSNATTSSTILRSTGNLRLFANYGFALNRIEASGNPYPSRIDLTKVTRTDMSNFIWVWDPKLTTGLGLGAFQTLEFNGTDFTITPGGGSYGAAGSVMNTIESGQGFFAKGGASGSPQLQFPETSKSGGSSQVFFTGGAGGQNDQALRINLSARNGNDTTLLDGIKIGFDENYSNSVDIDDADKMQNTSEALSIKTPGKLLAIESHLLPTTTDTIQLNLGAMRVMNYQLRFKKENWNGLEVLIGDRFTSSLTPLCGNAECLYDFAVTATAGTYAADRFYLVFKPAAAISGAAIPTTNPGAPVLNTPGITLFPNPAGGSKLGLSFIHQKTGTYHYALTDAKGALVSTGTIMLNQPSAQMSLNLQFPPAQGVYKLSLRHVDGSKSQTISVLFQ